MEVVIMIFNIFLVHFKRIDPKTLNNTLNSCIQAMFKFETSFLSFVLSFMSLVDTGVMFGRLHEVWYFMF